MSTVERAKWIAETVYGDDWSRSFERAQAVAGARLQVLHAALKEGE